MTSLPLRMALVGGFFLALVVVSAAERATLAQPADPVAAARRHLSEVAGQYGWRADLADLAPTVVREGQAATYVRFQQTVRGVPVADGSVTVALPHEVGRKPSFLSHFQPGLQVPPAVFRTGASDALLNAYAALGSSSTRLRGEPSAEAAYLRQGKDYQLGWRVVLPLSEPLGTWLVELRADTGAVLSQTNLLRFDSGRVFDPNPAKSSGGAIPPPPDCDSAGEEAQLAGQYQTKTLLGITGGQDKLKGQYADLTAPGILGGYKPAGQADELSRNYIYLCTNDRFEETMVYYHVDTVQRKIQSLGFTGQKGIMDQPIPAHAHYFSDCNAFYDPADQGIHFGDSNDVGCSPTTDTAEDADVIVHEYGHAIQDDQVPAWGFGKASEAEQAWAMGEGFSDFLPGAIFGDPCLGEWVSFGKLACGGSGGLRTLDNTKHYPEDFNACRPTPPQPAEPHCAGLIWGGALWDLVESLGNNQAARDLVLTLVLESHFFLDPVSTFAEAAAAIRFADSRLYGGSHIATIDSVFSARGISSTGPISDFPYAYLRIRHTFPDDLDIQLKVGSTASPLCQNIWDPDPTPPFSPPDLVGYVNLTASPCASSLPPSTGQPWFLEVRDVFAFDVGTIEEFEIVLRGPIRCVATDLPQSIPDAAPGPDPGIPGDDVPGPPVYSVVDCSTVASPYPASDPDGDGFSNSAEVHVGTGTLDACGNNGWPADLDPNNGLDIGDFGSFIFPLRGDGSFNKFGHTVPDPADSNLVRWDLEPNSVIDIGDLGAINPAITATTARPPMFGGQPAFAKTCPFPP